MGRGFAVAGGFKNHIFSNTIEFACSRTGCYRLRVSQLLHSVQRGVGPPTTIFSDSQGALQALRNPCPKNGQFLVTQITLKIHEINISNQTSVILEWSPGHSHIPGNEMAHNLAQHATRIEAKASWSAPYPTLRYSR